jgi:5-oxopent-3-ene-1,2,5-tricarboxylate decarboxylase / 2-hydroxyhepta-2,4-diene-1,7-dioate isomerase
MKHARVACFGAVHDVIGVDGVLRLHDGRVVDEHAAVWLPPLAPTDRARTIVALGRNYQDRAKEFAFKAPSEPDIYLKASNVLIGHRGCTIRPALATFMHYACELAVVIGRSARRVTRADAYDYVAGYSVANDYIVRDYVEYGRISSLRGKGRDGCTALGPWLVDTADIRDPMNLRMRTWVNDAIVQESNTRDMVFDIRFLIAYLTSFMTLNAGDVILTGTPEGFGGVLPGDEVVTEIEGIGRLASSLIDAPGTALA